MTNVHDLEWYIFAKFFCFLLRNVHKPKALSLPDISLPSSICKRWLLTASSNTLHRCSSTACLADGRVRSNSSADRTKSSLETLVSYVDPFTKLRTSLSISCKKKKNMFQWHFRKCYLGWGGGLYSLILLIKLFSEQLKWGILLKFRLVLTVRHQSIPCIPLPKQCCS